MNFYKTNQQDSKTQLHMLIANTKLNAVFTSDEKQKKYELK